MHSNKVLQEKGSYSIPKQLQELPTFDFKD